MREAMRALAQGVVASYEARATGLASIRRDVSAQRERDRRHIRELEARRQRATRTLRGHLARGRAGLKASVSAQVQELDRAHNAMARQQRRGLAKAHADLNRAETGRKAGVHSWMEEVASAHQAMAQELRDDLSRGHADLRASVSAQLHELDVAHQAMARQQQEGLAKVHADLNRAETRRKAGVRSWIEEVAAAHGAARKEWQSLARTMQAKRGGGVVVAEAPPRAAPARPAVEEVVPAAAVEEEAVEVGEVTEELVSLSERVFAYLASHPDGTRLTELEREFGLGRFQAARAVRHLMNDGKAKKQGLLYLAT